jgi:hypothetical protein
MYRFPICYGIRDHLKGDPILKVNNDHLSICANIGCGISFLHRRTDSLQKRRLAIARMFVVLPVQIRRELKNDIEVTEAIYSGVSAVGTHIEAVCRVGRCRPEVSIETPGDRLVT